MLGLLGLVLVIVFIAISRRDAQTVLTLVVVLLFLLPQDYVLVGPLKSVGNPAQLVGMLALALWCAGRILGLIRAKEGHPIRWVILLYAIVTLSAFAAAWSNATLTEAESAGAARALFPVAAAIGIGLLAVDGLVSRECVMTVLQRLVWVGGVAALIGIVEFAIQGFSYRDTMLLPGLTTNTELIDETRSGFDRIHAAASHPIEYAVSLGALAPLALHFAVHAKTQAQRQLNALAFLAICAAIPMTVARSGVVTVAVGLAFYAVHLSSRAKLNFAVLGVIGLGLYRAMVPGLLGTLKSLLLVGRTTAGPAARSEAVPEHRAGARRVLHLRVQPARLHRGPVPDGVPRQRLRLRPGEQPDPPRTCSTPNGATFVGKRVDADCEFLASTDNWFRPVHLTIGPDGAIYVLDFYREVIETPLSLPDDIKKRTQPGEPRPRPHLADRARRGSSREDARPEQGDGGRAGRRTREAEPVVAADGAAAARGATGEGRGPGDPRAAEGRHRETGPGEHALDTR